MANYLESIVKLPTSRKILYLGLLIALIFGAYVYLRYLPNQEELRKKRAEMEALENQVRQLQIVEANMKQFREEAERLRKELNLAVTQLPTSKEIPTLLSNISKLGKDSGLEFLLFKPAAEVNRDFYAEIPVEIRVRGTYHNVALFFDKVGKLPRIVNISEVGMDNVREAFGRWEINTSCTATTFKFLEREAADAAKDKKDQKPGDSKGGPPTKP